MAAEARVSIATVSRVINGNRRVSPDLRSRVLSAMDRLGYQPNAIAQGLRRSATRSVGVLIPRIHEPFFSTLAFAIERTLFASDYRGLLCSTEEQPDKERAYVDMLLTQQVDAFIYFPSIAGSQANLRRIVERGIPVVLIERSFAELEVSRVLISNFQGGYDGAQHLIALGHTHIGVICANLASMPVERLSGAQQALTEAGVDAEVRIMSRGSDFEAGYEAALDMLHRPGRPTAVFALADSIAVGVLHAAAYLDLRVPEDLSVVGFDNISLAAFVIPPLTTVAQPIYAIGEAAVRILLHQLQDPGAAPETVMLNTELVVRQSTAPCAR
ncbi:MAG: LacI family transcriptional regulator [Chloroflexi bacterium]|nr:LacI family transcriptional regulator [Chloroflexota bacterium]